MANETRTQTIMRNTRNWAHGREEWLKKLTHRVMENYHALVPENARTHAFSNTGDAVRDMHNNKKFVERCMSGEIRFPADMEEAWVMALDDPYRARLVAELAHRYGLMAVYEPKAQFNKHSLVQGAKLMRETSEALEVVAQIEMDGEIDGNDFCYLQSAANELDDVANCALTMKYFLVAKINLTARCARTVLHH